MRAMQNVITVEENAMRLERFYIYSGDGKVKYFKTVNELKEGMSFVTEYGYNAIGIEYSMPNSLPGAKDILIKYDGETCFRISNDINVSCKNEILSLANNVKSVLFVA